jgi:hypothetical protein
VRQKVRQTYRSSDDGTIEILAAETLGHYADWLGLITQRLRNLNGLRYGEPLVIGQRLKLDLSKTESVRAPAHGVSSEFAGSLFLAVTRLRQPGNTKSDVAIRFGN